MCYRVDNGKAVFCPYLFLKNVNANSNLSFERIGMKTKKRIFGVYCRYIKRILDIFFSFALILLSLPIMIIIAIAIKIDSRGRIIFKQKRMGRGGRAFTCYKFRTMRADAPPCMPAKEFFDADKYVTRVGLFLRRSSLDELPQLFNVFLGSMSLVGPRPLICEEERVHKKRREAGIYALRPGMTGLAQINGRNLLCDSEKIENDRIYAENVRMRLDVKIVLLTVRCIIAGQGISAVNNKK